MPTKRTHDRKYVPAPAGGPSDPFLYEAFVPGQEDEDDFLTAGRKADRAEALYEAIDKLPDRQREYMLASLEGMSQREIAAEFGVGEAAVSLGLKRARAQLAVELAWLY